MSPSRFEKTLIRTTPNRGRPKLMPKLFSTLLVAVKIGLSWKKMVRSIRFISVGIKEHTHMGASINFDKRITDWFLFCIASYRERSVFCDSLISGFKLLLRKKKVQQGSGVVNYVPSWSTSAEPIFHKEEKREEDALFSQEHSLGSPDPVCLHYSIGGQWTWTQPSRRSTNEAVFSKINGQLWSRPPRPNNKNSKTLRDMKKHQGHFFASQNSYPELFRKSLVKKWPKPFSSWPLWGRLY